MNGHDAGFIERRRGPVRVLVRADLLDTLGEWLLRADAAPPADAQPFASGRGGACAFGLADGRRVVWRSYRRGGVVGRIVRASYLGFRARPFREVAVTAGAAARGIACAEVLAARVVGRVLYGGAVLTAELPDARPVLHVLRTLREGEGRVAVARAAGRAIGAAHALGLAHADLNCDNVLVRCDEEWRAWLIDFDRARLVSPPLPRPLRVRSLARLERSRRKLDPTGALVSDAAVAAFRLAYETTAGAPCEC